MSTAAAKQEFEPTQLVKLSLIDADPHNPRKDFPKEELQELAHGISLRGVLQAITVRPVVGGRFRIVYGERRFRAAALAGLQDIKAEVRNLTDIEAADMQLEENLRRADLSPLEVAGGYQRQLDLGRTMEQVCQRAGRKRSAVYAQLQLLNLGPEGRKSLGEKRVTASVAELVAAYPKSVQPRALSIVEGPKWDSPLTYREARAALERELLVDLRKAPFDLKAEGIPCVAKSCAACPNRVGNQPELFPDAKNKDACCSPVDYRTKVFADARAGIEAKGWKMMKPEEAEGLFFNAGAGAVDQKSGYVETSESCHEDAQNRPYKELLQPEQLKKLVRVAVDAHAKPRQLLEHSGLMREVKRGGAFKPRKKSGAASTASSSSSSAKKESPARYRDPPPSLDDLVERAGVAKLISEVEAKGLTPAVLKGIVFKALERSENFCESRGLPHDFVWRLDEKKFNKQWPRASAAKLAALLYESVVVDEARSMGRVDELLDESGVDTKKLRAEVERANPVRWSEDKDGATGEGRKGEKYLIEKKGKSFVFTAPKVASELSFDSIEKAKATAAKVETGLTAWKPQPAVATPAKKGGTR